MAVSAALRQRHRPAPKTTLDTYPHPAGRLDPIQPVQMAHPAVLQKLRAQGYGVDRRPFDPATPNILGESGANLPARTLVASLPKRG